MLKLNLRMKHFPTSKQYGIKTNSLGSVSFLVSMTTKRSLCSSLMLMKMKCWVARLAAGV